MSGKTLLVLLVIAAALAVALTLRGDDAAGSGPSAGAGVEVFPGLREQVNDATALTLSTGGKTLTVRRAGDAWTLVEKDGYPAKFETVKRALVGLAELRTLESKTNKPELYAKLGVEDPAGEGATSTLVRLTGPNDAPLAALIVGKPGPGTDTLFVRRPDEAGSWLVRGSLPVDVEAAGWMDRELPRLDAARVKDVTITHADGEVVAVTRPSEAEQVWAVQGVPEGMEVRTPTVGRLLAGALEYVSFDEVRAASSGPLPEGERAITVFQTFDGLKLTATTAKDGETVWCTLVAEATEGATDAVKEEVGTLTAKLGPWAFQVPDYRASNLRKRTADLVQPIPPPAEEAPVPEDGAPGDATPGDAAPRDLAPEDHAGHGHEHPEPIVPPPAPDGTQPADEPPADDPPADAPPADAPR